MRRLAGILLCAWLSACGGATPARPLADETTRTVPRTLVYECNGLRFTARTGPGEIALWLPDRYVVLPQVRAASGARYEDGGVLFWSKGDGALLTVDGQAFEGCRLLEAEAPWEDARRRGVDLRAVGESPDWTLEIQRDRHALFVEGGGMRRAVFASPRVEGDGGVMHVTAGEGDSTLRVEAAPGDCRLGEAAALLPLQVSVTVGGRLYTGCGRLLEHPWE